MLNTLLAVAHENSIELLENKRIPEGTKVLVTILPDESPLQFWLKSSEKSLDAVWNNSQDDVYAKLL